MRCPLALLCVLSVLVAGCAGAPPDSDGLTTTPPTTTTAEPTTQTPQSTTTRTTRPTPDPTETIGFVEAEPVADVPANATVANASHPAIANVTPIQQAVREAVRTGDETAANFTRRKNRNVSAAFDQLPRHRSGWFVRYDGQVVQVWYAVQ